MAKQFHNKAVIEIMIDMVRILGLYMLGYKNTIGVRVLRVGHKA
jgi:hypothetical protein